MQTSSNTSSTPSRTPAAAAAAPHFAASELNSNPTGARFSVNENSSIFRELYEMQMLIRSDHREEERRADALRRENEGAHREQERELLEAERREREAERREFEALCREREAGRRREREVAHRERVAERRALETELREDRRLRHKQTMQMMQLLLDRVPLPEARNEVGNLQSTMTQYGSPRSGTADPRRGTLPRVPGLGEKRAALAGAFAPDASDSRTNPVNNGTAKVKSVAKCQPGKRGSKGTKTKAKASKDATSFAKNPPTAKKRKNSGPTVSKSSNRKKKDSAASLPSGSKKAKKNPIQPAPVTSS